MTQEVIQMRSVLVILLILSVVFAGAASAAPKTKTKKTSEAPPPPAKSESKPESIDVAIAAPELSWPNFHGQPIIGLLQNYGFNTEPCRENLRPAVYAWYKKMSAAPTMDVNEARIVANYSMICFAPQETILEGAFGTWWRNYGGSFRRERWVVRTTCTIHRCNGVDGNGLPICGQLAAGPFLGIGKASSIQDFNVFVEQFFRSNGIQLQLSQSQSSTDQLQFQAAFMSLKNLKPCSDPAASGPIQLRP